MSRVGIGLLALLLSITLAFGACASTITWVATSGYVIGDGAVSVAIDAFLAYRTTEDQQLQMREASGIYDVDIILVTHSHHDHFSGDPVADNMRANPAAVLVGPEDVIVEVRDLVPELPDDRFHAVAPALDEPIHLAEAAIDLTALSFPHPGAGQPENVGYIFDVGDVTFFHAGDLNVDDVTELFAAYDLGSLGIDVVILPTFIFMSTGKHEAIQSVGADCLIPSHTDSSGLASCIRVAGRFFDNLVSFSA